MTESEEEWIPLLSPKSLEEYSAEEFHLHVISLYHKKPKKTSTIRLKKQKPPVVWKLTPKGKVTIKINRKMKYITPEEILVVEKESGRPANEVFLAVKRLKIQVMTEDEAAQAAKTIEELPW